LCGQKIPSGDYPVKLAKGSLTPSFSGVLKAKAWVSFNCPILFYLPEFTGMRLGTDGTIAVPVEYQKELGWKPGDEVKLEVAAGALVVRQLADVPPTGDLILNIRGKGRLKLPTDEVMKLLRPE
jgi:bifunctional DNA-binding transcriptional regulator/antitoxin component of YhaV-PrlF toxin-antitoxin module